MSKVIIFSRVSTSKQTLEQQTEKLVEEANKRGYSEEDRIVIEEKESGSRLSITERLGLVRLKEVIEKYDDIDCIIIYELSRLSRRPADLYQIRDFLIEKKINLISLTPYMELLDEDGKFNNMASVIFGIYSSLSEQEGYLRVERVKRGIAKKKSEGKVMGKWMIFGYRREDGRPVINEEEAVIVREIFDRFEAGESCGSIGKDMYLRGVFGSDIKRNSVVCRVSNILHEERYSGNVFPFEGIVSKKKYDRCREIIKSKDGKFARTNYTDKDYICAGLLYTDKGYAMNPSYGNNRYQYRNPEPNSGVSLNMKITDRLSIYALKKYLESGVNEKEREEELKDLKNKYSINNKKLEEIDRKIKSIKSENEMIETRIIKGRISESKGDSMIDANIVIIKKLEESKDDIIYENGVFINRILYLDSFLYSSDNDQVIIADTVEDKRRNLKKYIDKIIVQRVGFGKFKMKYLFKDKVESVYYFLSIVHKVEFYDSEMNLIQGV